MKGDDQASAEETGRRTEARTERNKQEFAFGVTVIGEAQDRRGGKVLRRDLDRGRTGSVGVEGC